MTGKDRLQTRQEDDRFTFDQGKKRQQRQAELAAREKFDRAHARQPPLINTNRTKALRPRG